MLKAFIVLAMVIHPGVCGPSKGFLQRMNESSGEVPLVGGLKSRGNSMTVVLGNSGTGTWSKVDVYPDGVACLREIGDGLNLYQIPDGPEQEPL